MILLPVDIGFRENRAYVIGDEVTRQVVVVDAGFKARKVMNLIEERDLTVTSILATHSHRDHVGAAAKISKATGAPISAYPSTRWTCRIDRHLRDGDKIEVGAIGIDVLHTPGHTQDSVCFLADKTKLFVGDSLFVGRVSRSSPDTKKQMRVFYDTIHQRIMTLDDDIEVWPGHDVGPTSFSTIGKERESNDVLNMSFEEFYRREWDEEERKWVVPRKFRERI